MVIWWWLIVISWWLMVILQGLFVFSRVQGRVGKGNFTPSPSRNRTWQSPVIRLLSSCSFQSLFRLLVTPDCSVFLRTNTGQLHLFPSLPLQNAHRYYECIRPLNPHRYVHARGVTTCRFSLNIGYEGSHVPYIRLNYAHATSTPDVTTAVITFPCCLSLF